MEALVKALEPDTVQYDDVAPLQPRSLSFSGITLWESCGPKFSPQRAFVGLGRTGCPKVAQHTPAVILWAWRANDSSCTCSMMRRQGVFVVPFRPPSRAVCFTLYARQCSDPSPKQCVFAADMHPVKRCMSYAPCHTSTASRSTLPALRITRYAPRPMRNVTCLPLCAQRLPLHVACNM